jgi:polysaccharide biosynthesis transport protein
MHSEPPAFVAAPNLVAPNGLAPEHGRFGRENERALSRNFGPGSLRRHWRLMCLCGACVFLLATALLALKTARYTASTQLLVYTRELHPASESVITPGRADVALVQNQIEILRAHSTLSRVVRLLRLTDDAEFATPSLVDGWLAGIFAHTEAISEESRAKVERAVEVIQKKLSVKRVGTSYTIILSMTANDPDKAARIANEIVRNAPQEGLSEETEASRPTLLRERLRGLGPSTYVMSAADPPRRPDGPRRSVLALAAMMLGIIFGGGLAVLADFRNRTIRTAEQVEALGVECLGLVPRVRRKPADSLSSWAVDQPHSMTSQTLRRVQAVIRSSGLVRIGVTSAVAGSGAGMLAENLARLMAASGKKVLLVCDAGANPLRSCATAAGHDDPNEPPARMASCDANRQPGGLGLLTLDRSNGPQFWSRIADASHEAGGAYDIVIAVLPPLVDGPECRIAAAKLHGLLLVLDWGKTDFELTRRLFEMSGDLRWKFIGAVFNMVDEQAIGTFGDKFPAAEAELAKRRGASVPSRPLARPDRVAGDTLSASRTSKRREVRQ